MMLLIGEPRGNENVQMLKLEPHCGEPLIAQEHIRSASAFRLEWIAFKVQRHRADQLRK
jgi:hypothetical protein